MPGPKETQEQGHVGPSGTASGVDAEALSQWWDDFGNDLPRHPLGYGGDHGDTGDPVQPLYTSLPEGSAGDIGLPGQPPFVRGAYETGYVTRPWLMIQYSGFGTVTETNERWRSLIEAGQRAVSLAFDLPTHLGYDSDDEFAEDEVGKAGVAIDSLADFEALFDGIDLTKTPATFNTAAVAPIIAAMYQVIGEEQGIAPDQLAGTITNDNLSAAFRGTSVFPSGPGVRLVVDVIEYCTKHMPRFTPVNVQGVYMRSVGATKAQEVGYALAVAIAYLEEALSRGITIEEIAPRFSFFFQCDSHFFEEAAKFRAGRRVWSDVIRDRFGSDHVSSQRMRTTGVSAARCFTKEEPEINLVRGAYSALGCALGGVQGMWISGFDEAFATPTAKASRLALRTMQILAQETGVRATIDPLGGGYFTESLTDYMVQQMKHHIEQIDEQGGAVAATDSGFMRRQMLEYDLAWAEQRERGERPIVANNVYVSDEHEDREIEFQRFRTDIRMEQLRRLEAVRDTRDDSEVKTALDRVRHTAGTDENLMPAIVDAVRCYATVGEIMTELRAVFGEWTEAGV